MTEAKQKILVIEDNLDLAEMLDTYFRAEGYEIQIFNSGEAGLQACENSRPDILILDIRLPDINGYEVARRLRQNRRTSDIPIIFLTEKRERAERLQGLELGADDFISKPFDVKELRLRIRNTLRRLGQDSLTNPTTGIPEGRLVDEHLIEYLHRHDWSILIISLDKLDAFRDSYGFVASDDVMRAVSLMIQNVIKELGKPEDFLGHLNANDLILLTMQDRAMVLEENIRSRLEQSLDYFYPIEDREKIVPRGTRLIINIGELQDGEGNFTSLDEIKLALLQKKP